MTRDALRYMRAKETDAKLINNIKSGFERLNNIMRPRKIYGVFNIVRNKNYLSIANINLNSLNLNNLLINSQDCCLMAVTLGHETDREILIAQNRSMADGLILDACASVMADVICDNLELEIIDNLNKNFHGGLERERDNNLNFNFDELELEHNKNFCDKLERERNNNLNRAELELKANKNFCENLQGEELEANKNLKLKLKLTPRFSPGYGDVPLEVSQEIIEVLNADKYIGLSITRSGMMSPVKSITAFAGVVNNNLNFNFNFNKCEACNNNQNCEYKI